MAAALFSFRAVALAALLLAVIAACGARAQLQPTNASADSQERSLLSYSGGWIPAKATWYGAPTGAGPDDNGGACGFKHTNQYPFSSMTSCGNEPIFKDGKGCGSCYQIRCLKSNHPACSGVPQTVVITDMNYYPVAKYHFDLSGTAFGSMATYGLNDKLRHAGIIDMQFRRVPCNFPGLTINFVVQHGSNQGRSQMIMLSGSFLFLAGVFSFKQQCRTVKVRGCSSSSRTRTATWCRWTSCSTTPATGSRCTSPGDPSGGSTLTARSRAPTRCASPTSPASSWWPRTSSRTTTSPTPTTAPTSSTRRRSISKLAA